MGSEASFHQVIILAYVACWADRMSFLWAEVEQVGIAEEGSVAAAVGTMDVGA